MQWWFSVPWVLNRSADRLGPVGMISGQIVADLRLTEPLSFLFVLFVDYVLDYAVDHGVGACLLSERRA